MKPAFPRERAVVADVEMIAGDVLVTLVALVTREIEMLDALSRSAILI